MARTGWKRHAADAALGIVLTVLSVGLVEGVLALAGVTPAQMVELSRGFDPEGDYVYPDPDRPGHHRTAIGMGIDERSIPPAGKAERLLLFGGSNTRGFGETVLRRHLNDGRVEPEFEILNLGRSGYGSGRVTILFEQALAALEPDVVVIYCGHNEFTERSFRAELEAWGGDNTRLLASLAQRMRSVRVLRDLGEGRRLRRKDDPNQWRAEYARFEALPYTETLAEFERYGENLRRMLAVAQERGVKVVLSTLVYNRFSIPRVTTLPDDLGSQARSTLEAHLRAARQQFPDYFQVLRPDKAQDRVSMDSWGRTSGNEALDLPGLRPLVGELAGVQPAFLTGNRDPRVDRFYGALAKLHGAQEPEVREALQRAAEELDAALALLPEHPGALFDRALVAWALGARGAQTKLWFEDAARFDRAPRKATPLTNERVRLIASEFPDVCFVDADALAMGTTADGIVGWELMTDHCHLSPLGGRFVQHHIGDALLRRWYGWEGGQ